MGGMCYENQTLMFYALKELGFEVSLVQAFPGEGPFAQTDQSTHAILIVALNDKRLLVDVGYGYYSIRSPLELDFDSTVGTSQAIQLECEKYQFVIGETYYQMYMWSETKHWVPLFRFSRPLSPVSLECIQKDCTALAVSDCPIRRKYIKAGLLLSDGRVGFHFEPKNGVCKVLQFTGSKMDEIDVSPAQLADTIYREIGIQMPCDLLVM
eukprot:Gregarina_sp_Poly_1__6416@NODE_3421_length_1107_cov_26_750000_g2165_i0_p1_GENE_NODE_3421_length_1107_cov_26_750000_g2165_i0NODE_3421_length_1107_cov_26_750000_g2165_i0_p1_ORF_typecomplete_len210_score29_92Acetyltransf_2/PF00797_17/2_6e21DUF553/PF04473_12/0_0071ToxPLDMTX/PF15645_6/0_17ToxPLDMTX/PF15645_6/1_4e03_NODE_3421_length_1107_cov_26_750000_g2165_i0282911